MKYYRYAKIVKTKPIYLVFFLAVMVSFFCLLVCQIFGSLFSPPKIIFDDDKAVETCAEKFKNETTLIRYRRPGILSGILPFMESSDLDRMGDRMFWAVLFSRFYILLFMTMGIASIAGIFLAYRKLRYSVVKPCQYPKSDPSTTRDPVGTIEERSFSNGFQLFDKGCLITPPLAKTEVVPESYTLHFKTRVSERLEKSLSPNSPNWNLFATTSTKKEETIHRIVKLIKWRGTTIYILLSLWTISIVCFITMITSEVLFFFTVASEGASLNRASFILFVVSVVLLVVALSVFFRLFSPEMILFVTDQRMILLYPSKNTIHYLNFDDFETFGERRLVMKDEFIDRLKEFGSCFGVPKIIGYLSSIHNRDHGVVDTFDGLETRKKEDLVQVIRMLKSKESESDAIKYVQPVTTIGKD